MSYQVIARKWRPQTFQQLIGQEHVTQTFAKCPKKMSDFHMLCF